MKKIMSGSIIMCFSFLILITSCTKNQGKIYFCEDFTSTGEPKGTSSKWTITPSAGNVYILFSNDNSKIKSPKVFFYIDFMKEKDYTEYDTKYIVPEEDKSFVVLDYKFTKPGDYRVTVYDDKKHKLATEYVTITMKEGYSSETGKVSTDYYSNSTVTFCENVDDQGKGISPSSVFTINKQSGSYVYLLLENGKPLKATELIVDIWKGDNYKEFVETKKLTIDPEWASTYYKYTFTKTGKYKFSIFTQDETFVQSGYVTIN